LVHKTLSFSKELHVLQASCISDDWVYNLTPPVKALRLEVNDVQRHWQPRSLAIAAGLTDHIWTVKELLTAVIAPNITSTK
jgi:hypothetical protein